MYVNRIGVEAGYKLNYGRLRVLRSARVQDSLLLYDGEGWREKPPLLREVNYVLAVTGAFVASRAELPEMLFTSKDMPVAKSQLPLDMYIRDTIAKRIYLARAVHPMNSVGRKYICWNNVPDGTYSTTGEPKQYPIPTTSIKNKKLLKEFTAWLDKLRDINRVVHELDPTLTTRPLSVREVPLREWFISGMSPHAAYAELPPADWVMPLPERCNIGAEFEEVPYLTWR